MNLVGLDIGGANLKAADLRGRAVHRPFALWKSPERLADEVRSLLADFPATARVALTMTGELCDCFTTRSDGVRHIVASVRRATPARVDIYTTAGTFRTEVDDDPLAAAASNWLALASYAGRVHAQRGTALLIDLGSTTCDIIPLRDGHPVPVGRTDSSRLSSNELIYCGVRRTPLCAVFGLDAAAEFFATMDDAFLVIGKIAESESTDTSDGRPRTKRHAMARLARMQCDENWSTDAAEAYARRARDIVVARLARSVAVVAGTLPAVDTIVTAGEGEFLLPEVLAAAGVAAPRVSLAEALPAGVSAAACAYAVAVLAEAGR